MKNEKHTKSSYVFFSSLIFIEAMMAGIARCTLFTQFKSIVSIDTNIETVSLDDDQCLGLTTIDIKMKTLEICLEQIQNIYFLNE